MHVQTCRACSVYGHSQPNSGHSQVPDDFASQVSHCDVWLPTHCCSDALPLAVAWPHVELCVVWGLKTKVSFFFWHVVRIAFTEFNNANLPMARNFVHWYGYWQVLCVSPLNFFFLFPFLFLSLLCVWSYYLAGGRSRHFGRVFENSSWPRISPSTASTWHASTWWRTPTTVERYPVLCLRKQHAGREEVDLLWTITMHVHVNNSTCTPPVTPKYGFISFVDCLVWSVLSLTVRCGGIVSSSSFVFGYAVEDQDSGESFGAGNQISTNVFYSVHKYFGASSSMTMDIDIHTTVS